MERGKLHCVIVHRITGSVTAIVKVLFKIQALHSTRLNIKNFLVRAMLSNSSKIRGGRSFTASRRNFQDQESQIGRSTGITASYAGVSSTLLQNMCTVHYGYVRGPSLCFGSCDHRTSVYVEIYVGGQGHGRDTAVLVAPTI